MKHTIFTLTLLGLTAGILPAADFPSAVISSDQIRAKVYLPDAKNGFYRSTRFDWSGVIGSLEYKGHNYYGPWFKKITDVFDFGYEGTEVISAPFTAMVGPGEEYLVLGYDDVKAGGTFVKIGVGVLRRADDTAYSHSKPYEIVDGGKWTIKKNRDSIDFTQQVSDPNSHYGYLYKKTVRLVKGEPRMVIEHSLKNTGTKAIKSNMYNHNFLVLDNQPPGPDFAITVPFQMTARRGPAKELGEIRGNQLVYLKTLAGEDRMTTQLQGFSDSPKDYDIRVENRKVGAGVRITGDRPLSNVGYWSIRTVLAVEPYITIAIEPAAEFAWKINYEYYTLPADQK
jgi:hypothetical protein